MRRSLAGFRSILPRRSRLPGAAAAFVVACLLTGAPAPAAEPPPFTAAQLDQMLAPIALFPDALLSQVLMASTYPSDVALAVDWAYAHRPLEGDAAVQAVQDMPWDPSVQSLVAFPQTLAMLGESPEWVRDLGDAFLAQPEQVMDSVQLLRAKAREAGNLKSDEHQVVALEPAPPPPQVIVVNAPPPPTQIITIVPARPQVVFVPVFHPRWVFGPWWHPAFPPFFFPPPVRWGWGGPTWGGSVHVGFWWGRPIPVTHSLWGGVHWGRRSVNINVNHWNTIHVNHRINSRDANVAWRHDPRNRRGVPYRGAAARNQFQPPRGGPRDAQRDRARLELANRLGPTGPGGAATGGVDRSQLPQRPVAAVPGAGAPGSARDRAAGVDRAQIQNRAANVDRAQVQNRIAAVNRDNALRGAGNAAQTRQQIERGASSLGAIQQRAPGAAGAPVRRP